MPDQTREESVKKIMPLMASLLLVSGFAANAFSGSSHPSTSPVWGTPEPIPMSCSLGWNANNDYITTAKNTAVTFSPLANDADTPQQNFAGILSYPQHGTAEQVGLDSVKYTPAAGYTGSDSFTYEYLGCVQCYEDWCAEEYYRTVTIYLTVTN